ncbi:MAG: hypothetical protein ABI690_18365 [Chloroflexota bacterium]
MIAHLSPTLREREAVNRMVIVGYRLQNSFWDAVSVGACAAGGRCYNENTYGLKPTSTGNYTWKNRIILS